MATVTCPECGEEIQVRAQGTIRCPCGHTFSTGNSSSLASHASLYGARRRRVTDEEAKREGSAFRDFYFPLMLLILGLAAWIGQALFRPLGKSPGAGLVVSLILLVFGVVIMLAGVFVAAKMLSINFGSSGSAAFKLVATAICGSAAFAIFASVNLQSAGGPIVGWHALILVYIIAFKTMFDLDLQETLLSVGIIGILQAIAAIVLFTGGG